MCFMRICDYKFAVYGFFAEHKWTFIWTFILTACMRGVTCKRPDPTDFNLTGPRRLRGRAFVEYFLFSFFSNSRIGSSWCKSWCPIVGARDSTKEQQNEMGGTKT